MSTGKQLWIKYQRDAVFVVILILVFISAYNIGRIKAIDSSRPEIKIMSSSGNIIDRQKAVITDETTEQTPAPKESPKPALDFNSVEVVASKKSKSGVYHFPWCPGAAQIKDENKLKFTNEIEAQAAGYTLAGNCSK